MGRLDDKTALITGAARGLGRAHALAFAREGANLVLVDVCRDSDALPYPLSSRQQLEETAQACRRAGSVVLTAVADVRSQDDVDRAVAAGMDELGRLDVLVNNAGLLGPAGVLSHELDEQAWTAVLDVNLTGAWRCCRAVLPHMVARRSGSIVNVASTGGLVGFERFSSYVASKHGLVGLTRALALDYGTFAIRVNAVCPTVVRTEPDLDGYGARAVAGQIGSPLPDYEAAAAAEHPLRTLVTAEDVALASVWLASDESARVTGTVIPIDAGFLAR